MAVSEAFQRSSYIRAEQILWFCSFVWKCTLVNEQAWRLQQLECQHKLSVNDMKIQAKVWVKGCTNSIGT